MNKNNNPNSISTYHRFSNRHENKREIIFYYIKENPGKTRKEILYALDFELNHGGRMTELLDAGYIYGVYDKNQNADRLYVKKDEYNDKDFTSDKLEERKHLKAGSNKNSELATKIGQTVLEMSLDCDDPEKRIRFLSALQTYVEQFKKDKNYKLFEQNIDTIKRVFGSR